jgi:predicted transposase/invertase (TIGR01784 family)
LFKGRKVIKDLVYNSPEQNGPVRYYRKSIFDLTCTGTYGEIFLIEMQRAEQQFFTDRAVFYASSKIYDQAPRGKAGWDFSLKEVYFIGLMDFTFDATPEKKYLHHVRLAEEEDNHAFYEKLCFIFIELPKFNLPEKEIKAGLERWLYVLRNMNKFDKIPVILPQENISKAF